MAPTAGSLRVRGYFFALFAILAVLYLIVFFPGTRHTPRLGLDLEGGTQLVLRATTADGSAPSRDSLNEARNIINDRVNGRGVAEAEVVTQGGDRIVVSIPGKNNADLDNIGTTARLNFRALCQYPGFAATPTAASTGTTTTVPAATAAATGSTAAGLVAPQDYRVTEITDTPSATASGTATGTASPTPSPTTSFAATDDGCSSAVAVVNQTVPGSTPSTTTTPSGSTTASVTPSASATSSASASSSATTSGSASGSTSATPSASPTVPHADAVAYYTSAGATAEQAEQLANLDCSKDTSLLDVPANANQSIVSCSLDGTTKFVLGRVLVPGTDIKSASAQAPDSNNLQWTVVVELKGKGQETWANYTAAHNSTSQADTVAANFVAFNLDGKVISSPHTQGAINTPQTQVTGSFTESSANDLANSLKYGALPLTFSTDRIQNVSATLGTTQLKAGLLAGGIGLLLVVLYSLLYYRGLGLVTIASLVISGALTYGSLVALGRGMGFTLTLSGIAGFIVAVGITADSFVVMFERIKDEVHEGRSFRVAVPRAWERARRTIVTADFVSIIAAVVLYYFTADQVRGFAFTLGLSTVLDLIVVFLFTHPLIALLSRSPAFGSAKFTGLSAVRRSGAVALAGVPAGVLDDDRPARPAKAARSAPKERPTERPSERPTKRRGRGATVDEPAVDLRKGNLEPDVEPDVELETDSSVDAGSGSDYDTGTYMDGSDRDDADFDESGTDGATEFDAEPDVEPDVDLAAEPQTRRSAAGGTAAERAAARRAKLREQKSGDEESGR